MQLLNLIYTVPNPPSQLRYDGHTGRQPAVEYASPRIEAQSNLWQTGFRALSILGTREIQAVL